MFQNNKSLSDKADYGTRIGRTAVLPLMLAFIFLIVAVVDQQTVQTLESYSAAMYSDYGVAAEPGAIYRLVYIVAGVLIGFWTVAGLVAWTNRRWSFGLLIAVIVVNALLAMGMLFATEYSEPVFPPLWGLLAALPAAAGVFIATVVRGRQSVR
jgi:uncharacterized protein YacL